ncbi:MAG TPA: hypothetical protein VF760_02725, partial [Xanthobacteraceae bacterium]
MTTANSSAPKELVTAALLVIGDEILSGRTKDKNIAYIAEYLTAVEHNPAGIFLAEREGSTWRKLTYEAARP